MDMKVAVIGLLVVFSIFLWEMMENVKLSTLIWNKNIQVRLTKMFLYWGFLYLSKNQYMIML